MKKYILLLPLAVSLVLIAIPYIIYADNFIMYQNSDSMYPAIVPGDLLIIERTEINDVKVDDIIAFETHIEGVDVLVRRVIEASPGSDGQFGIDTQGDDEEFHDPWTVFSDGYIGKLVEINPPLGILLSDYFRYPLVIVIVVMRGRGSLELRYKDLKAKLGQAAEPVESAREAAKQEVAAAEQEGDVTSLRLTFAALAASDPVAAVK